MVLFGFFYQKDESLFQMANQGAVQFAFGGRLIQQF
jgi:hypothetical protein